MERQREAERLKTQGEQFRNYFGSNVVEEVPKTQQKEDKKEVQNPVNKRKWGRK